MLIRILALALVVSTPVLARGYDRADVIRGLCRPDGCDEFSVIGARPLASGEEGTLMRTRLKTFHAGPNGRKDLGEEDGYVYCSRTSPAILADRDGRTMAFFLAPFATAESPEAIRKNANYHAVYIAICHGPEEGRAAVRDLHGVALSHSYDVRLPQSKHATLNRPEDILTSTRRGPVESRRDGEWRRGDEHLLPPREVPAFETRRDRRFDEGVEMPLESHGPLHLQGRPGEATTERDLFAVPRRLTNRAFDALDEVGDWVFGRW
jgi:hypothetical protein